MKSYFLRESNDSLNYEYIIIIIIIIIIDLCIRSNIILFISERELIHIRVISIILAVFIKNLKKKVKKWLNFYVD